MLRAYLVHRTYEKLELPCISYKGGGKSKGDGIALAIYHIFVDAVRKKDDKTARIFFDNGININPNISGLLNSCIKDGQIESVNLLLSLGAGPNQRDAVGDTPLITTIKYNHFDIAQLLLINGAQPNESDALAIAVQSKNRELCELLIKNGAKLTRSCFERVLRDRNELGPWLLSNCNHVAEIDDINDLLKYYLEISRTWFNSTKNKE